MSSDDYFSNHRLKLRFPWALYHRPIVAALSSAMEAAPGADILNVGAGPFLEIDFLPWQGRRIVLCDIDPRAVAFAKDHCGGRIAAADIVPLGEALPYPDASFDLVVAMEVIEHIPGPAPWLGDLVRVLRPGGRVFLTTPNYGSRSLEVLERTALEAIARLQGFTRRGMHPTRFDAPRLQGLLAECGLTPALVRELSWGWVLAATGEKPVPAEGAPQSPA